MLWPLSIYKGDIYAGGSWGHLEYDWLMNISNSNRNARTCGGCKVGALKVDVKESLNASVCLHFDPAIKHGKEYFLNNQSAVMFRLLCREWTTNLLTKNSSLVAFLSTFSVIWSNAANDLYFNNLTHRFDEGTFKSALLIPIKYEPRLKNNGRRPMSSTSYS